MAEEYTLQQLIDDSYNLQQSGEKTMFVSEEKYNKIKELVSTSSTNDEVSSNTLNNFHGITVLKDPISILGKYRPFSWKPYTTINIKDYSKLTKSSFRKVYEMFRAGKIPGYSRDGQHYIYPIAKYEFLNVIMNFSEHNLKHNVDIQFEYEEDIRSLQGYSVSLDKVFEVLEDLAMMKSLKSLDTKIRINYAYDHTNKLFYFRMIDINQTGNIIDEEVNSILYKYNKEYKVISHRNTFHLYAKQPTEENKTDKKEKE